VGGRCLKGTYILTKVVPIITELQMLTVVTTNNMKIIVAECPEFSGIGSSIQSYTVPKLTLYRPNEFKLYVIRVAQLEFVTEIKRDCAR
jgi:hypothetical protein